ncbi:hypothetical protein FISHEDRAFT_68615 [Fistulina hepatica ATCC 64428]|uniref:Glycogen [starch] synthase n=1 Tax=Fistulina hepatica ATCC 64428 TaxID=1128425 RepID=A0A0D7ASG7_9AGAR|nr:hypothetical protein FISHEDRAFT_68615 [Fistulina hepatica ATCC 64428]
MCRALEAYPTILFLHENAAMCARPTRVMHYSMFLSRLHTNVLVVDYRSFGDSEGSPSESGLTTGARAVWSWLVENGARQEDIVTMGVVGRLAADLEREGSKPHGLVLLKLFTSLLKLLETYQFFGVFALLGPLHILPFVPKVVAMILRHQFDTISLAPMSWCKFTTNVIIASSNTNIEIPASHDELLFDAFLAPHLLADAACNLAATLNVMREKRIKLLYGQRLVDLHFTPTNTRGGPHFHEWQAGLAIPLCCKCYIDVTAVFMTHATLLGRCLCTGLMDFYNNLRCFDVDHEAESHLENVRTTLSNVAARGNLASTFVNMFVNAGFGNDKLMVNAEESSSWIYKNKDQGMMFGMPLRR